MSCSCLDDRFSRFPSILKLGLKDRQRIKISHASEGDQNMIFLDNHLRKRFAYIFGGAGGASVGRVTEDFFRRWVVQ